MVYQRRLCSCHSILLSKLSHWNVGVVGRRRAQDSESVPSVEVVDGENRDVAVTCSCHVTRFAIGRSFTWEKKIIRRFVIFAQEKWRHRIIYNCLKITELFIMFDPMFMKLLHVPWIWKSTGYLKPERKSPSDIYINSKWWTLTPNPKNSPHVRLKVPVKGIVKLTSNSKCPLEPEVNFGAYTMFSFDPKAWSVGSNCTPKKRAMTSTLEVVSKIKYLSPQSVNQKLTTIPPSWTVAVKGTPTWRCVPEVGEIRFTNCAVALNADNTTGIRRVDFIS